MLQDAATQAANANAAGASARVKVEVPPLRFIEFPNILSTNAVSRPEVKHPHREWEITKSRRRKSGANKPPSSLSDGSTLARDASKTAAATVSTPYRRTDNSGKPQITSRSP
ncbi:hypothetical protein GLE_1397 [Lysobacter enzymogenes]|uniref:Uncharacterized protein n=1 Tax=Lysobacter enzymogenes TaxID=69 RepID=A0A0S2DE32_LYSEN|nr:hypothetical protein [Lysobacter enzymogenes]ALN56754.1 hypothetical protein GLE_1397 [Lysobacter enzymogenes]QCW25517.1 hypothetical protein FE772_07400 [Lysobacter enzymogenes]